MFSGTYFPDRRGRRGQASITTTEFNTLKTDVSQTKAVVTTGQTTTNADGTITTTPSLVQRVAAVEARPVASGSTGLTLLDPNLPSITANGMYMVIPMTSNPFNIKPALGYVEGSTGGDGLFGGGTTELITTQVFMYNSLDTVPLSVAAGVTNCVVFNAGIKPLYLKWNRFDNMFYRRNNGTIATVPLWKGYPVGLMPGTWTTLTLTSAGPVIFHSGGSTSNLATTASGAQVNTSTSNLTPWLAV